MALRPEERKEIIEIVAIALATAGVTSPPLQDVMNEAQNGAMVNAGNAACTSNGMARAPERFSGANDEEAIRAVQLAESVEKELIANRKASDPEIFEFFMRMRELIKFYFEHKVKDAHRGIEVQGNIIEHTEKLLSKI